MTVPLSRENNVGTFHLAPGFTKYDEFRCMMVTKEDDNTIISMDTPINKNNMTAPNPGIWKMHEGKE